MYSSGVSNTYLFALPQYYKLNEGYFLGFLFKRLGGLRPPRGLKKASSEKYPLFITCFSVILHECSCFIEFIRGVGEKR